MSCLTCLASYCPAHLEPHSSVPVLKEHRLVSATVPLQQKMCTKHNKLLEVYCQTDKKCICYLCVIDEHKNHCTVSAAAERDEEQEQLIMSQKKIQDVFQEREMVLTELVKTLKDFKSCSQAAVQTSDKIFDEMISSIKRKHTLAKQLINAREQTAVTQAEELQLQLEEEIAKLRRRHTELEQLSRTDDHIHFIQTFQSLSTSCESLYLPPEPADPPQHSFRTVTDCMSKLRNDIERLLRDTWPTILATVSNIDVVLPPVPKTREEFLHYYCPLTLNENSANKYLSVSQEYRRVTHQKYENYFSKKKKERFTNAMQVLCTQGLTERCYWEVSWSGGTVSVAVSYKDISRSSSHYSEFGNNDKSWSLECSPNGYSFQHNANSSTVSGPQSSTIGVYLDHKAGVLCFYSVSDKMTLLHKVHTTFGQPLYPGLGLKDDPYHHQSDIEAYAELIELC
uniref:Tripartite motif-containing protein 16 n=1 Tax=Dicentrarchus labrax TaxID=13489 RepID=A0A8P4KNH5_DICLA